MKNNKSPGSDGYTTEFFKFFWSDLKHFILEAINCIFTKKELPITLKGWVLFLVYQKVTSRDNF